MKTVTRYAWFVAFVALAVLSQERVAQAALNKAQLLETIRTIDQRQSSLGDYRADVYLEEKTRGKTPIVQQAVVYRRSADARFIILFTKPKTMQGQGYLRIDKNLWFYDPSIGKWSRRTERERIGGTNSRRSDFDEPKMADEYDPEDGGQEKLGAFATQVITLRGKPGHDLAFPVVKLWIDKDTQNILKRQEFALSGRLLRTSYYPKWRKVFSPSKQGDVWYPEEIRIFDELEKDKSTLVMIRNVDLKPLAANQFTKAWLESKSR